MKITDMNNNCTLRAVQEVTRLDDATIFNVFRQYGYKDHKGMLNSKWIAAARVLGLELEEKPVYYVATQHSTFGSYTFNERMTLGKFLKENPVGVWLLSVTGHALVVRDGRVIEYGRGANKGLRRKMTTAHRVLNAPALPEVARSQYIRMTTYQGKRGRSESARRYAHAAHYLFRAEQDKREVTVEELVR